MHTIDGITYSRFHTDTHRHLLSGVVECYRQVFAADPWNEWKKCYVCSTDMAPVKWGSAQGEALALLDNRHCGVEVEDYWPVGAVETAIRREVTERTSCWTALTPDQRVIGFTWGYPIDPETLGEELKLPDLADIIRQKFGDVAQVAYQDEIGVVPEFQNRKIGKRMAIQRLADFKAKGLEVAVFRTQRTPPSVTYKWFTKDEYKVIREYGDSNDRVILARNITDYEMVL